MEEGGQVPPGNAAGNAQWGARRARPEVRLTPGKGAADLTCSVAELIDGVVKSHKARGPSQAVLNLNRDAATLCHPRSAA